MSNPDDKFTVGLALRIGLAILVVWLAALWVIPFFYGKPNGPGSFGDMYGALNALFSGLALAGIVAAILLQRGELELQREELKLTRAELEGQKQQLQAQNETLSRQAFESSFFQLLRFNQEIANALVTTVWHTEGTYRGPQFFSYLYFEGLKKLVSDSATIQEVQVANNKFWKEHGASLRTYHGSLESIMVLLTQSPVEPEPYRDIIRGLLSDGEKLLLWYYVMSDVAPRQARERLRQLLVLARFPVQDLIRPEHSTQLPP